jgi:hypothetical protein
VIRTLCDRCYVPHTECTISHSVETICTRRGVCQPPMIESACSDFVRNPTVLRSLIDAARSQVSNLLNQKKCKHCRSYGGSPKPKKSGDK